MNDKLYDVLKYIQRIALPALIAFIATILPLCGVGANTVAMVTGIVAAVDTLLAALLQIESVKWTKSQEEQNG